VDDPVWLLLRPQHRPPVATGAARSPDRRRVLADLHRQAVGTRDDRLGVVALDSGIIRTIEVLTQAGMLLRSPRDRLLDRHRADARRPVRCGRGDRGRVDRRRGPQLRRLPSHHLPGPAADGDRVVSPDGW